ncbi:MAG: AAA family ATPase [Acidimicrobiales bacterium]
MDDAGFVVTKEYRRFVEFCDACRRERYIGLCYGLPGVGKTISARHYADWDVVEPLLRRYAFGTGRSPEAAAARTVVYTPMVANTPRMVDKELVDLSSRLNYMVEDTLVDVDVEDEDEEEGEGEDADAETFHVPSYAEVQHVELVIVDEADRLRMPSLEQLRDHYDRRRIGLVLIGMPGLEKRLARYPQLYSRVGFVHQYRPLGAEELRFILQTHWETLGLRFSPEDFTDAEAMAAVARITSGNFRLVHRLLAQVERILAINKITVISKEVVETARESLVIGAT